MMNFHPMRYVKMRILTNVNNKEFEGGKSALFFSKFMKKALLSQFSVLKYDYDNFVRGEVL